jgi:hypothetical protein
MIFFAEINKSNESHLAINLAMLEILLKNDFYSKIRVYGERKHLELLRNRNVIIDKIEYKFIPVIEGGFLIWPMKLFLESISIFRILRDAKREKVHFVFISSMFPLAHFAYLLIRPFFKELKVIIGLHGELQYIKRENIFKYKFLGFFLRLSLKNKYDKKTLFLVYSGMIQKNLLEEIPEVKNKVFWIDHPYKYSVVPHENMISFPLVIGSIGIASKTKNTHFIFKLSDILEDIVVNKNLRFKILGKSMKDILPFQNNNVEYTYQNVMIPKDEYQRDIELLHYIIFFYDNNFYSLSPSGVFFDAVEFEKPIIALKSDLFIYYFERFGNIGYLCDSLEDISILLKELVINFPEDQYFIQIDNIRKIKKTIDIENLTKIFWNKYD